MARCADRIEFGDDRVDGAIDPMDQFRIGIATLHIQLFIVHRHIRVTFNAIQLEAQHRIAALFGHHPGPVHQRRFMAYVLVVAASKLGDPVTLFVPVITTDSLLHPGKRDPALDEKTLE